VSVILREACPADRAGICDLLRASAPEFGWELGPDLEAEIERNLGAALDGSASRVWVALVEAQVAGYAVVHQLPYLISPNPEALLGELFVHPDHRGAGIGTALLDRVEEFAGEASCGRISLFNHRRRLSYRRGFYAERGYEERTDVAHFVRRLETPAPDEPEQDAT
jgi:GNAT superfamily N-acetyltransferase